jgi:hypothetical protein
MTREKVAATDPLTTVTGFECPAMTQVTEPVRARYQVPAAMPDTSALRHAFHALGP